MSTETGDSKIVADAIADAKGMIDSRADELEQLDLLDPVSPEDMLAARQEVGPHAGKLTILNKARENKRGRPAGSRNRRSDDFARWISQFGQHPAVTLMQIQATPTEVLQELSQKPYLECMDRRIRCAEALMPYFESKKPVAVDVGFAGIRDLIIAGVTHTDAEVDQMLVGEYVAVDPEADPINQADEA